MTVDEERLDERGQLAAIQDLQGQVFAHGHSAEIEGKRDTMLMRPRLLQMDEFDVITWSVGQKTDSRFAAKYDDQADKLELISIDDGTVRYNDFIAIPSLNVIAIDDRKGERHIGARPIIGRMRSVFSKIDGAALNVEMTVTSMDLRQALENWELEEVTFKVRPVNPHSRSDLSRAFSEAMKREQIGTLRAVAKPSATGQMRPVDGPIAQANALSSDGYGQIGVKGRMPHGHVATIPRAQFDTERRKNEKAQTKTRELRVLV